MRSLSNIIKYWGAKDESSDKIINSNPKADAFFSELRRLREIEEERKRIEELKANDGGDFTELDLTKLPKAFDTGKQEREAKQKASDIINEANEQAERIINQAVLSAEKQKEDLKRMAREQGYQEGYNEALEEIRKKERELDAEKARLQTDFDTEVKALVPQFTELVIKYVEKLTGILADEYESIIYNVLALAISGNEPSKRYIIYVPKEQYQYVVSKEDYIREVVGDRATFEVVSDPTLSVNSCKIETENCVIDTGLDTRLLTLVNSLRILSDSYK